MPRYVLDLLEGDLGREVELGHFNTSFSTRVRSVRVNPGHARWRPGRESGLAKYRYVLSEGAGGFLRLLAATGLSFLRFAFRVSAFEPQVVHIVTNMHWGYWRNGMYVLLARMGGCRVLFHPLGAIDQFHANSGRTGRRAISAVLDLSDLILVQSTGLAEVVSTMTSREVRGVFNGIYLEPFARLARQRERRRDGVEFLAVGDLGHNKGTFDILRAAGRVASDCPDCRWTFIGRGDLPVVERMAKEHGLEGRVQFAGAVDEDAKLQALGRADVFLLPSYAEGQPLSILEAMAAGLPVLSSTVGSIPEVVGEENGILVEPGDLDALEQGMRRLAMDGDLRRRIASANVEAARRRFDVRRLHREIGDTYLELCHNGRPPRRQP